MHFFFQEFESTKLLNENRRQTLAASYDVALTEKTTSDYQKLKEEYDELKIRYQSVTENERTLCGQISHLERDKQTIENLSDKRREEIDHLSRQIITIRKEVNDTGKALREKVHIMSLQDNKIKSMKLTLTNFEKETAGANQEILKLTNDKSVLCEKLNGTTEEISYLRTTFKHESETLRKQLDSQMMFNERERIKLMKSNKRKLEELNGEIYRLKSDHVSSAAAEQVNVNDFDLLHTNKDIAIQDTMEQKQNELRQEQSYLPHLQTAEKQLEHPEFICNREILEQYMNQVEEQNMRNQSQYKVLVDENGMLYFALKRSQDYINHLEIGLSQKHNELLTMTKERHGDTEKVETDYKQKLANMESLLKKEMGNQKDLMNELQHSKKTVNELQSDLREKRTSYESSLAVSSKTRESDIERLREEHNDEMVQLERKKNRQIEDEKQHNLNIKNILDIYKDEKTVLQEQVCKYQYYHHQKKKTSITVHGF